MYPDEFDYYRAGSVDEALSLLEEHAGADTELLAGGHSLLPTMKSGLSSPDVLIDIGNIDAMNGIEDRGDTLSIGATTTYATVAEDFAVQEGAPALAAAAHAIGDVQVRNRGTVGGNVAHSDPASDLPGAMLATDATIVAQGPGGEREIPVDDFFQGMYMTALEHDEILTRVEVPKVNQGTGAYAKKPSPSSGYALVGVAVRLHADGDTITSARVGANGAMDHGVRLEAVEDALAGSSLSDATAAARHATDGLDVMMMMEDQQASSEFRAQLLEVYTERALESAVDQVSAGAAAD